MSVIVAVKENGVVYMGADSQTTIGKRMNSGKNQTAFKVAKLDNGMLVGFCGRVAAKQEILSNSDVFVLNDKGDIDKEHIVKAIVPKLVDKMEVIGDEESGGIDVSLLIAYKDKLYQISSNLHVSKLNRMGATGAGAPFTKWFLCGKNNLRAKDRVLKALMASARRTDSVSGPYVLIDTKDLEYQIIDMGGRNY